MSKIKLEIDLPPSVLEKLEATITAAINKTIDSRLKEINQAPIKLSRSEAAKMLRISLVTIDKYEREGVLKSQRFGRRVLYDLKDINNFLNQMNK